MSTASKVWTHIINGFALLAAGVKIAIDAIAAWWGEWGGTIMTIAGAVWETVKAIFVAAFEVVESLFLAFIAIINGDWEELGEQLMDIWEAALTFISTLFNTWWSVFKVFVVAALEAVKTFFGNAWQWVLDKVSSVVDGIKALLDPQTWLEVGTNLLNGIVQGVRNAAQGLIDAVVGAARAALDAVKGFLGIQSPSKVAAKKIGLPFAEGIAAGISDGIKTLQAQNWGIDLNNTMAKASMNSGYGNSQQNINKYLNLTVYTSTPAERITTDFRYLEAIG
jgi:phage-related protein